MNFYPPPPLVTAELFVQVPTPLRCIDRDTEWRGGFAKTFKNIFLEGPVADKQGNLFVVDVPYGRILCINTADKSVEVAASWDGEPNGLALRHDGTFAVADYKQVSFRKAPKPFYCTESLMAFSIRGFSNSILPMAKLQLT